MKACLMWCRHITWKENDGKLEANEIQMTRDRGLAFSMRQILEHGQLPRLMQVSSVGSQ